VMRILPRTNDLVNEEWISDKTRYVYDGLKTQRLDQPYVREMGKLRPATWAEALSHISRKLKAAKPERTGFLIGDLVSAEEAFAIKALATALGSNNVDCRVDGSPLGEHGGRAGYIFNSTIAGIEDADAIMLIGCNPRLEAPVLNARIRKRALKGGVTIGVIGERSNLTYDYHYIGAGAESLAQLADHAPAKAQRPMFILGQGALARKDGAAILALAAKAAASIGVVKEGWNGFNVLHTAAGRVGALDVCALPGEGGMRAHEMIAAAGQGNMDVMFLAGADEIDTNALGATFVVYIGTHGDAGANRADVILPGAAYTEKSATYVNTEGRPQMTARATFPPGEARDDWSIIAALAQQLGVSLGWNTLDGLRAAMYAIAPQLAALDTIHTADAAALSELSAGEGATQKDGFASPVKDFYFTNPIARASRIMADCSQTKNRPMMQAAE
jgi:NADH-quinone oxidoreductase subunit G